MALTLQDMQRELSFYAMAEMRNRGLEAAALAIEDRARKLKGADCYELISMAATVRGLKTNPVDHLSDWWGNTKLPLTDNPSPEGPPPHG